MTSAQKTASRLAGLLAEDLIELRREDESLGTVPDSGALYQKPKAFIDPDGGDSKIGASEAQCHGTHRQREQCRKEKGGEEADDDDTHTETLHVGESRDGQGHAVGPDPHKGDISEIHIAGHAHEDIEGLSQGTVEEQGGDQLPHAGHALAHGEQCDVGNQYRQKRSIFLYFFHFAFKSPVGLMRSMTSNIMKEKNRVNAKGSTPGISANSV